MFNLSFCLFHNVIALMFCRHKQFNSCACVFLIFNEISIILEHYYKTKSTNGIKQPQNTLKHRHNIINIVYTWVHEHVEKLFLGIIIGVLLQIADVLELVLEKDRDLVTGDDFFF